MIWTILFWTAIVVVSIPILYYTVVYVIGLGMDLYDLFFGE